MFIIDARELRDRSDIRLGASSWQLVTRNQIADFNDLTGTVDPMSTDLEYATSQGLRDVVAPPYFLTALSVRHFREVLKVENQSLGLNYGSDDTHFLHPVCAGDRVRYQMTLVDGRPHPVGTLYRLAATLEIEGVAAPALTTTLVFLTRPTSP